MMLKIEHLSCSYDGRTVLSNFNCEIATGAVSCVEGPSGIGKSTLARTIAGHLVPDSGRIQFEGRDITGRPSRQIFMVSQESDLFPWQTVEDQIKFVYNHPAGGSRTSSVDDLISFVKLESVRKHFPRQLSGGMQKRLALAKAMAIEPKVLILDEVFSSQDEALREDLISVLLGKWKKPETTVILISHDPVLDAGIARSRIVLGS